MLRMTLAGIVAAALLIAAALTPLFSPASAPAQLREEPAGPTLKLGDAAPKLYASKWLNGKAIESFEKDKVYVIDVWATWCGPCIQAMPHLSKLNDKYKDKGVVFIGLSIDEEQDRVEPFI